MLSLAYYLLNVILCSGLLYSYYVIALRNKKFHQYNRFYLLLTVALSIIIPLLKIQFWSETAQQPPLLKLLTSVSATENYAEQVSFKEASVWDWELFASCIFSVISSIFFFVLAFNLVKIFLQIRNHPKKIWNNICFVFSNTKGTPYSFFKYIFWNNTIDINTNEGKHILQHELTHVQQKHSADKLFINIVLVAAWANPFFWLIRKELNLIHEFIADQKAISDGDADAFATMLLSAAYPQHGFMLTNSFFHSPIKRRLLMLTKSKLPSYSYLRRLMILPLLSIVTILFAFKVKEKVTRKIDKTFTALVAAGNQKIIDDRMPQAPEEKIVAHTFQDTGLKKNKRQIEVKKGAKIRIEDSTGHVAEISSDASKPIDTTKNSKVLVVLDGEQMTWKEFGEKNQNLQPGQIMQVNVLKDKLALDKYGQKGQFGVIEITTKSPNVTGSDVKPEQTDRVVIGKPSKADEQYHEKVFTKVEQPAKFPGGEEAWKRYLERNQNNKLSVAKGVYTVNVKFIVNEDGTLNSVTAEVPKDCQECGQEAIKLIKKGPKWEPAVQNGKTVVYQVVKEITFNVE